MIDHHFLNFSKFNGKVLNNIISTSDFGVTFKLEFRLICFTMNH